jgi:hypothetical protein
VAVDDGGGKVDQLSVVAAGALAQHLKGGVLVDGVALHEDALGSLGERAASERASQIVVFPKPAQHDVNRALPVLNVIVCEVSEHATLGSFLDELWGGCVQQRDHGAGGLTNDLLDQFQRVLGALAKPDERDVGSLPGRDSPDVFDLNLTCDDLMAKGNHDRGDERKMVFTLVGYQNAQMVGAVSERLHTPIVNPPRLAAKVNPPRLAANRYDTVLAPGQLRIERRRTPCPAPARSEQVSCLGDEFRGPARSKGAMQRKPAGRPLAPALADERLALLSLLSFGGVVVLLLILFAGGYGYHRDELYFLAAGERLAWSYPDQGPVTPLLAHLMSTLGPGSLTVLRVPSAFMTGGTVLLTGAIAGELGGRRRAQLAATTRSPIGGPRVTARARSSSSALTRTSCTPNSRDAAHGPHYQFRGHRQRRARHADRPMLASAAPLVSSLEQPPTPRLTRARLSYEPTRASRNRERCC